MSQNDRYQGVLAIKIDTYNDAASLKNVLELARALKKLFTDLNQENWVIGSADNLASACLEKILTTPGITTDDLNSFFHQATSSAVRLNTLNYWRADIAKRTTKDSLLELVKFFKFAQADSAAMENYLSETAKASIDDIYVRLLTALTPAPNEARDEFHAIGADQRFSDATAYFTQVAAAPGATNATMLYARSILAVAIDEAKTRSNAAITAALQTSVESINQNLALAPATSDADRKAYFHLIQQAELRRQVLDALSKKIPAAATKEDLGVLRDFFLFAATDSASYDAWLPTMAKTASDAIVQRILLGFDTTDQEAAAAYSSFQTDQAYVDVIAALKKRAADAADSDPALPRIVRLLEIAATQGAGHPDWVAGNAKQALDDIASKIALSANASYATRLTYFDKIQVAETRRLALEALAKPIAQLTSKSDLIALRDFFFAAAKDSSQFDAWLPHTAVVKGETISQRLLTEFDLTDDETKAAFQSIQTDQTYADVIAAVKAKADAAADSDSNLPKYVHFFELALASAQGHPAWVATNAQAGIDAVSMKIALAKDVTIETREAYFHKISQAELRRQTIQALLTMTGPINDRPTLMTFVGFFSFASSDSSTFDAWLPQNAQQGADTILQRILGNYDSLPTDEAEHDFHLLFSDQARLNILNMLRPRVAQASDKAALLTLNQFFNFAIDDSAGRAPWVYQPAIEGRDGISIRAITELNITDDEARIYFSQLRTEASAFTILTTLTRKMERNRDSYPVLLQMRRLFKIASQETSALPKWVSSTARAGLDNATARIIKKPVIDADEMIALFDELKSDASRADVLNYWRGKIAHAYDDKDSMLKLARFFSAAKKEIDADHNGAWVADAANTGGKEITHKILALFPYFEGDYDIESTCVDTTCGTGFLDTMVILNTESSDSVQITFMHAQTGTPAFVFSSVVVSKGGASFDAMSDAYGRLSVLHVDLDPATGSLTGTIENSDRIGRIAITGSLRRSVVPVYDQQIARSAQQKTVFPAKLPDIQAEGSFGEWPATLSVRTMTAADQTVVSGVLTLTSGAGIKVVFQVGDYNPKNGMLTLVSAQPSGARVKLVLALEFGSDNHVLLTGTSFNGQNNEFHDLSFTQ